MSSTRRSTSPFRIRTGVDDRSGLCCASSGKRPTNSRSLRKAAESKKHSPEDQSIKASSLQLIRYRIISPLDTLSKSSAWGWASAQAISSSRVQPKLSPTSPHHPNTVFMEKYDGIVINLPFTVQASRRLSRKSERSRLLLGSRYSFKSTKSPLEARAFKSRSAMSRMSGQSSERISAFSRAMASAWSWVSGSRYSLICTRYLPFPRLNAVTAFRRVELLQRVPRTMGSFRAAWEPSAFFSKASSQLPVDKSLMTARIVPASGTWTAVTQEPLMTWSSQSNRAWPL